VSTPGAFDALAPAYDVDFTNTKLGRLLRQRVWDVLSTCLQPGQRVLELACGTGEDAIWLARQGLWLTATDGSAAMLAVAKSKAQAAGVERQISFQTLDLATLGRRRWQPQDTVAGPPFDGALSNFGGLNVIGDWRPLAQGLAELVRPGGWVALAPMGPFCPWEMAWHLAHADLRPAFRRLHGPAEALIGDARLPIHYPHPRRMRRDFAPWFRVEQVQSLGLWLPPSYLGHLVDRFPGLFDRLARLETRTAHLTRGLGDHYLMVLRRAT
jgi:SAM-dependent methyltransferase